MWRPGTFPDCRAWPRNAGQERQCVADSLVQRLKPPRMWRETGTAFPLKAGQKRQYNNMGYSLNNRRGRTCLLRQKTCFFAYRFRSFFYLGRSTVSRPLLQRPRRGCSILRGYADASKGKLYLVPSGLEDHSFIGTRRQSFSDIPVSQDGISGSGAESTVELVTEWFGADLAGGCGAQNRVCGKIRLRTFFPKLSIQRTCSRRRVRRYSLAREF